MGRRRKPSLSARRIAKERVNRLWELALETSVHDPERTRRYVEIARRVSRRVRERLPRRIARRVCRGCGTILLPGVNCRVRVRNNRQTHVTVTCLRCGTIRRFPVTRQS
ncbi:MAG: ribonuclease P [Candidatus Thorarchaeota archaeon]|nr:MAG: ribonuclease P [Candidatus Thorarchaeota archaeon]RLI61588.1 MAG: ribonuclease P [Candidatus Thorarchaeota archaeon]